MNIRDIARLCNVSAATVSKVLHNDPSISEETKKKILEVTKQYHYVPYASVLKSAAPKLNIIAVAYDVDNVWHRALVYEIEKRAFQRGYNTTLYNAAKDDRQRERYEKSLENKGISGTIYLEENVRIPGDKPAVVLTSKRRLENTDFVSSVRVSLPRAAERAVAYLYDRGHRKLACITDHSDPDLFTAYEKACREKLSETLSGDTEIVFVPELAYEIVTRIIADNITALICTNRSVAREIYVNLLMRGVRVPEQISLVVLEDPGDERITGAKFTLVGVENGAIAEMLTETLIDILENDKKGYAIGCMMEPGILPGASVASVDQNHFNEKIVVIGTINMDYNLLSETLPEAGKTIRINSGMTLPGGKGANQAVGVGKLGGHVFLLGCLGNDQDGHIIYEKLQAAGVHMDGVTFHSEEPTGKAYIAIDSSGDSLISVLSGANNFLTKAYINDHAGLFEHAKFCLLNSELPADIVAYAIRFCHERGIRVILKPAAIRSFDESLYPMIDYLLPNLREAEVLIPGDLDVREKAERLYEKGVKNVIITMGAAGCYLKNGTHAQAFPALDVPAVDVTGASDAFISCLAVELCRNVEITAAIDIASYAAGVAVTQYGAQNAMIDRNSLNTYIEMTKKD